MIRGTLLKVKAVEVYLRGRTQIKSAVKRAIAR